MRQGEVSIREGLCFESSLSSLLLYILPIPHIFLAFFSEQFLPRAIIIAEMEKGKPASAVFFFFFPGLSLAE